MIWMICAELWFLDIIIGSEGSVLLVEYQLILSHMKRQTSLLQRVLVHNDALMLHHSHLACADTYGTCTPEKKNKNSSTLMGA